jgi:arabinose-5-phosphate isomerase
MHGDIGLLAKEDVLLVLSYSGESEELNIMLPAAKRLGAKIVGVTAGRKSRLAKFCNVLIPAKVDKEACPFNMAPTSSTTATLAIGDALAMVLSSARGFKKEDYARLHPGGAIGRTLLLRVADIMRTGDRCARVRDTDKVKEAMLAMTKARSGSVGVVDAKGKCLGIFTDGDLRRHLFGNPDLIRTPVTEVMTRAPISVTPDMLAVEVLEIYETHNIDDLLVVDKAGKLVGAVDIQDLPRFKIM